jgi:predicted nucleic acid-binding protein
MKDLIAVYDACVLYSAPLRDLLMRVAVADLCRAKWTEQIHQEWMRNVLEDYPQITPAQVNRVRQLMDAHVRDGLVTGYESIIEQLNLPDADDRHVLAAAIHAQAEVIVTYNLKDFPASILDPLGVTAQHPDEFILSLIKREPEKFLETIERHRQTLQRPPKTREEYLATLEKQGLSNTVSMIRQSGWIES